jgi:hypothetical protein
MKLYYSTPSGTDKEQRKIINSIGGYKSSTPVPVSKKNSLFGDITDYTVKNNLTEYICLFLVNDSETDYSNVYLHFVYPDNCYTKWKFAAVDTALDSEGYQYVEKLVDRYSQPWLEFNEANGIENKVDIGSMTSGQQVGLYISRELIMDTITADYNNRLTKVGSTYQESTLLTKDDVQIVITLSTVYGDPIGGEVL